MQPPSSGQPIGLAIEVIGREGSIALMKGDQIQIAKSLDAESRAASALIPAIAELLDDERIRQEPTRIVPEYLSVAIGPGSFTGLRIAVAAAKTLAFAWEIPLVAVDSLSAIARLAGFCERETGQDRPIFVGLSAYRGQVFRGNFNQGSDSEPAITLLSRPDWECELDSVVDEAANRSLQKNWLFAGDRAAFERSQIEIPEDNWADLPHPWAAGVGLVAAEKFRASQTISPMDVVPNYFRPSAAEEKG